jgi:hypothetical protein
MAACNVVVPRHLHSATHPAGHVVPAVARLSVVLEQLGDGDKEGNYDLSFSYFFAPNKDVLWSFLLFPIAGQ